MAKEKRPIKYIEGYSESLWKSLVVKSIRMGWINGLVEAEKRLPKSTIQRFLISGIFEDLWPHPSEIWAAIDMANRGDYAGLLSIDPHHGKGLSETYCNYHPTSDEYWYNNREFIFEKLKENLPGLYVPTNSLGNALNWMVHKHLIPQKSRTLDETPFRGIPPAFADQHTPEGWERKTPFTLLCGHPKSHRMLGSQVQKIGWDGIRRQVHSEGILPKKETLPPTTRQGQQTLMVFF